MHIKQNLLNAGKTAAVDDMSINMWNASLNGLAPAGSESHVGTSQTNMSSVKGKVVRKAPMQG